MSAAGPKTDETFLRIMKEAIPLAKGIIEAKKIDHIFLDTSAQLKLLFNVYYDIKTNNRSFSNIAGVGTLNAYFATYNDYNEYNLTYFLSKLAQHSRIAVLNEVVAFIESSRREIGRVLPEGFNYQLPLDFDYPSIKDVEDHLKLHQKSFIFEGGRRKMRRSTKHRSTRRRRSTVRQRK